MSDFGFNGGDVYAVAVSGGAATDLTPGLQASATAIGWSCDGRLLVSLLAGGQTRIVELGAQGTQKRLWSGTESLEGADSGLGFGCTSPVTAFVHESFTAPPQIEIGPIGGWHDLRHANTGMTMPLESQSVTWKSDNGICFDRDTVAKGLLPNSGGLRSRAFPAFPALSALRMSPAGIEPTFKV